MTTITIPILFDISGSSKVMGESFSADPITSHLEFTCNAKNSGDAGGKFLMKFGTGDYTNSATGALGLVDLFKTAFRVYPVDSGATNADDEKIFGCTTLANVDNFCVALAEAIISSRLDHSAHDSKNVTIGGTDSAGNARAVGAKYDQVLSAGAAGENMKTLLLRCAATHLVGHPLSQAIFTEEDSVTVGADDGDDCANQKVLHCSTNEGALSAASALLSGSGDNKGVATKVNKLAAQLSKLLGGSLASGAAQLPVVGTASSDTTSDIVSSGITSGAIDADHAITPHANSILKSILEQILAQTTRSSALSEADISGTKMVVVPIPLEAGDSLEIFIRPKLNLEVEAVTGVTVLPVDSTGTALGANAAGNNATAAAGASAVTIDAIFPGATDASDTTGTAGNFNWMGSANDDSARKLTANTTDSTEVSEFDAHIWKITMSV